MSLPYHDPLSRRAQRYPDRCSVRVALAAALLREGCIPTQVADITGVPFALVEWLAEHPGPQRCRHRAVTDHSTVDFMADDGVSPLATAVSGMSVLRARWRVRMIALITMGWLLDCVLSAIALAGHYSIIGVVAVMSTPLMIVVTVGTASGWGRRHALHR